MPTLRAAFALSVACLLAPEARAQAPRVLGYQGRLLRSDGTAATGTASVSFAVFDAASAGSQLWTETQTLGLSDGYYATFLGLATPQPDGLFEPGNSWIEVRVGNETLAPRQQAGAVPYAATAQSVVGSASLTSLRVGGQTVVGSDGRLAGPARYTAGAGIAIDASQTISLPACADGQTLAHDATSWFCAPHNAGTVTSVGAAAPLAVANAASAPQLSIAQAGASSNGYLSSTDWNGFDAKYGTGTLCGGDLSGAMAAPTVVRLQSRAVSAAAPGAGQVLKWNASAAQWEPTSDVFTNVTAVAPLTAQGSGSTSVQLSMLAAGRDLDGYLASADWALFDAKAEKACGGDLSGSLPSPTVSALQTRAVASDEPQPGQVLYWDATAWRPETLAISDVTGLSSGYLALTGDQTISGAKTFTTPLGAASGGMGAATAAEHTVFAGPSSGTGAPAFRALAATDIPPLDASKIATGTLDVARGGTGTTSLTAGSVLFAGASGISQDNARLFWDDTNHRLGLGTASPADTLEVAGGMRVKSLSDSAFFVSATGSPAYYRAGTESGRELALVSAGAEVMRLASGGNVGIGTSAPARLLSLRAAEPWIRLEGTGGTPRSFLVGTDASNRLDVYDETASAYRLSIAPSGNVGVSNSNPGYRLDVSGAGSTLARLAGGAGQGAALTMGSSGNAQWVLGAGVNDLSNADDFGVGTGGENKLVVRSSGSVGIGTTSPGSQSEVNGGTGTGRLSINGAGSDGYLYFGPQSGSNSYLYGYSGRVQFNIGGTESFRVYPDGVVVGSYSRGGSTPPTDGMIVSGNVGIGTASPGAPLEIAGTSGNAAYLRLGKTSGAPTAFGEWVGIDFLGVNEVSPTPQYTGNPAARVSTYLQGDNNRYGLQFWTRGNAGSFTEKVRVTAEGSVGIGTSAPGFALDVAGTVNAAAVFSGGVPYDGPASLAQNGSFEIWGAGTTAPPSGWGDPGGVTFARDTVNVKHGSSAMKLTWTSAFPQVGSQFPAVYLAGRTVTMAAWIHAATAGAAAYTCVRLDNWDGVVSSVNSSSCHSSAAGWERVSTSLALPAETAQLRYRITQSQAGTATVDSVMLVVGTAAPEYSDKPLADSAQLTVAAPSGNVGVGTASPGAKLDVAGEVRVGSSGSTCSATNEGAIRYNSAKKTIEYCSGSCWGDVTPTNVAPAYAAGVSNGMNVFTVSTMTDGQITENAGAYKAYYPSSNMPASAGVQFAAGARIRGARFHSTNTNARPRYFRVEYSSNGSSWTKAPATGWTDGATTYNTDEAQASNADAWQGVTFQEVQAAYWRITWHTGVYNNGNNNAGMDEFEFLGTACN